ncbi:aminobenzoate synthetase [Mycolicibacterium peregrinum]|uniref:Aminobenzoate synthetase n=1 Tax=Mycolicibacterium peregrinum TaxID=43304 RepID=A0A1A0R0Z2_MYCPR|nr:AAA family ATPase [Mycolicibacterium peregrinum]OBB27853.1 aminobenzoate synthetase [Mycolicibacterium peregrinum]
MALDEILGRLGPAATTVLIDGRSGSGKSTLAARLRESWADSVVIRLDDIYPGWDGLAWAAEHVQHSLLEPRAEGRNGRWRQWDWTAAAPSGWHAVEPGQRLIVEGIGALTPAGRALADLGIWVDADDTERKHRALERDGETYRPHWDRWAAQEDEFIARFQPRACADLIAVLTAGTFEFSTPG